MPFSTRIALLPPCLVIVTASQAQVKAVVYNKGKAAGTVVLNSVLKSGGNLAMTMDLRSSSGHLQVSETFAPSGMPIEEIANGDQAGAKVTISLSYGATGVKATANAGGKSNSRDFPYPKGANLKERNNFWFITHRPKVGELDSYTDFDIQTMSWKAKSTKYAGDEKIKYHGKLVNTHKMVSTDDTSWLDDKGLPYRSLNNKTNELLVRQ